MTVRMHTYRVGPDDLPEFLSRRAAVMSFTADTHAQNGEIIDEH
ncbi:hypothetical protein [Kribbella sp. NPDC006257]